MHQGAQQVSVGLKHVDGPRGEGGPDHHVDALDLIGP